MIQTRRPALKAATLYVAGILAGYQANPPLWPLFIVASLLLGLWACLRLFRRLALSPSWPLAIAIFLVACLQYEVHTRLFPPDHIVHHRDAGDALIVQGTVVSDPVLKGQNATLILETASIDLGAGSRRACGKIWITVRDFRGQLGYGDRVRLRGQLRAPGEARNPGEFDFRAYLARRSVHAFMTLKPSSILEVKAGPISWTQGVVRAIRQHLERTVSQTLGGAPGALLRGVMLGQRRGLPPEIMRAFSDCGVIHVLAVSGLHIGLVVGIFFSMFRTLRLREGVATLLTLALIFLYMYVIDLRPSVVRATIMAGVVMLGRLVERESDLLNAIAFAGLVILCWNPQFLFDLGFQLSFVATLSIVYLHGRLKDLLFPFLEGTHRPWIRWLCSGFLVSLSAQLGTLPIIAASFQRVPIISVVANLLVVPLIGLVVALGFASALLGLVSMGLARLYAAANWLLLTGLLGLVNLAASLPFAYIPVSQPSGKFMVFYYGFLVLGANIKRSWVARRAFVFGGLLLLNLWVWEGALETDGDLSVLFFDVGQGDATLVRFPNQRTMLIDGGERKLGHDCGERVICPYLRRAGIGRLDVVVLTHADNDHVGGLPAVLQEYSTRLVLDSGARQSTAAYLRFLELAHEPEVAYRQVRAGDVLEICPQVKVTVLHPTGEFVTDEGVAPSGLNNASVVLKVQYGVISFLLTGDVEEEAEEAMLRRGQQLHSTVLKTPHHGSNTSSTMPFLKAIGPRMAVVSVGWRNRFGHPHQEVLERYERLGVALYRTDLHGAVMVETDGRKLKLRTVLKKDQSSSQRLRRPDPADLEPISASPQMVWLVWTSFLLTSEEGRVIISKDHVHP
jgi:competence protein ComEC